MDPLDREISPGSPEQPQISPGTPEVCPLLLSPVKPSLLWFLYLFPSCSPGINSSLTTKGNNGLIKPKKRERGRKTGEIDFANEDGEKQRVSKRDRIISIKEPRVAVAATGTFTAQPAVFLCSLPAQQLGSFKGGHQKRS